MVFLKAKKKNSIDVVMQQVIDPGLISSPLSVEN